MGQGDSPAAQGDGKNRIEKLGEDVSHVFSGIFQRGKKKVEEQVENIDQKAVEEQARKLGKAAQRHVEGEVQGIQTDIEKARNGDPSALVKRGVGMATQYGTFGAGGVAADVARRMGLGKQVDGIINRGVEELTKVDSAGFVANLDKIMTTVDTNGDGFMERAEIDNAKKDKIFWAQYAFTLKYLGDKYDTLQNLSNDEWFSENNGISRGDIDSLRNGVRNGTGFGTTIAHTFGGLKDSILPAAGVGGVTYGANRFLNFTKSGGKAGLIAGGVYLVGSTGYSAVDYLFSRKGKIEQTLKELG